MQECINGRLAFMLIGKVSYVNSGLTSSFEIFILNSDPSNDRRLLQQGYYCRVSHKSEHQRKEMCSCAEADSNSVLGEVGLVDV
jgi:hypothetical protein